MKTLKPNLRTFMIVYSSCIMLLASMAFAGQMAVVATTDPMWTAGAISMISVEKNEEGARTADNLLNTIDNTDTVVAAFGDFYYRLERMDNNNVTKYSINSPEALIWQYSCQGEDAEPANVHDMVFISETKAYLLRYGTTTIWVVNPSAATEAEFKTGEIDLSAYADNDGEPEINTGVIVDGKLFVTLQRVDLSGGWGSYVYHPSYLAVIDTATDTEIDTGVGENGLKGIPLSIKNAGAISYLEDNATIYVQGSGADGDLAGGIVTVNPQTYEQVQIVDDDTTGDGTALYGGRIFGMALVSADKGYFVTYAAWGDCSVYEFNPGTGAVSGVVQNLQNLDIAGMANGLYVDENDMLWVNSGTAGGATNPEIIVLNTQTNEIDERISTSFNPGSLAFVGTSDTATPDDGGDGTAGGNDEDDDDDDDSTCFIQSAGDTPFIHLSVIILGLSGVLSIIIGITEKTKNSKK